MRKQYRRPPVREALINIVAQLPPEIDLHQLTAIAVAEDFPTRELLSTPAVTVGASGVSIESKQELLGYRYIGAAKDVVLQVRRNGFAFSRLHPYERWEDLRDRARHFWDLYRQAARPLYVSSLSVRYINRIDFPPDVVDLSEYLLVRPELPDAMAHAVSGFVMRVEMPQPDIPGAVLALQQGRIADPRAEGLCVLLDLELTQNARFPADGDHIWQAFEVLHDRENDWFEGSITQRTRDLFD